MRESLLTLCLPVLSADNLGKQFGPRSGPTNMYLCSENEDADQLSDYCVADLYLYFRICKKAGFLMTQLIFNSLNSLKRQVLA